jgi:hypothetical protein
MASAVVAFQIVPVNARELMTDVMVSVMPRIVYARVVVLRIIVA